MLSSEEKKEKEQFFRDLDRLNNLDDDDEEEEMHPAVQPAKRPPNKPNTRLPGADPTGEVVDMARSQRQKRKLSQEISRPERKVVPQPRLTRAFTLPEQRSKEATSPKLQRNMTDLSNLDARMKGSGLPKLKPLPKGKKIADIPAERRIFTGLVFFFVPNNDDDSGTRLRIHQAIKYGARWAHKFCEEVTHIIVTRAELDVTVVAKSFPSNKIPEGPILLRERWLWESWGSKYLQETHQRRFQVAGSEVMKDQTSIQPGVAVNAKSHPTRADPNPSETMDDAKRDHGSKVEANAPKPKHTENIAEDALEIAIRDVRDGADLRLNLDTSDDSESDDGGENRAAVSSFSTNENAATSTKNGGFLCMESHDGTGKSNNPNAGTIDKLQEMATSYDQRGDQWRTRAFRQAIGKLRRQSQLVRTNQQARKIGIGESVAAQVEEIVSTGRYKRLEYQQGDPRTQVLQLFMGVYGAGQKTAEKWIAQGYRSLEDLYQKADLTANQRVGLDHYEDFQQRIPRSEVEQHAAVVEKALKAADPNFQLIIGGSYRRGSKYSGDIDCIIFMEGAGIGHIRTLILGTVIPDLTSQGFLKTALAGGHFPNDDSSKWHGASVLPGSKVWRRIDFLFVPWEELGAALIYFTGNDLFNRSIRFLAGKKGMRLNQHGLFKDVMRGRGRQRINDGTSLEARDEKRIFEILGVPHRPPEERNV